MLLRRIFYFNKKSLIAENLDSHGIKLNNKLWEADHLPMVTTGEEVLPRKRNFPLSKAFVFL
jgi:hypothetical protein